MSRNAWRRSRVSACEEGFMKKAIAAALTALVALLTLSGVVVVSAHGGEDHGEERAPTVSAIGDVQVHTARAGDIEVMLKHKSVEPDREGTARVFVTRFDSNEPITDAKVTLSLTGDDASVAAVAAGISAGMYEAKLPPLARGEYKLVARVEYAGTTESIDYGELKVTPASPAEVTSESSWARTLLIVLGALTGLSVLCAALFRAAQSSRSRHAGQHGEGRPTTA